MACHVPGVPGHRVPRPPGPQTWGAMSPTSPTSPPHLSEGDRNPKSKLSSVTKRTSGGDTWGEPRPPSAEGGTWRGDAALALPYLAPRPSPPPRPAAPAQGLPGGERGVTHGPQPCPRPPPVSPTPGGAPGWHRPAPGDGTRRCQAQPGLCATGDGTAGAGTARPGGARPGDPHAPPPGEPPTHAPRSRGVLCPSAGGGGGGPGPAPQSLGHPSPTLRGFQPRTPIPGRGPSPLRGVPAPHPDPRGTPAPH